MQKLILSLAIGTLATTSCLAAEVDSVSLLSELTYGYGSEIDASVHGLLEISPAVDVSLTEAASLVTSARIRLDSEDELEPGRASLKTYASASRPLALGTAGSAEIRDFYLEFRTQDGLARFGKQQIMWGRLDGIKVLDLVNPQDFSEFILDDFAESRIALWSAYFDYSFGNWRAELAVVPDSTGHAIPSSGAWFELTAPRYRYGAEAGQPGPPVVTAKPGHSLDETAAGLRLSREIGMAEFSVVAYSGIDPEPLGRIIISNGMPIVERFNERREVLGFSLDIGLGPSILRAEYAHQPERIFNTRSTDGLQTIALDQHRGAIGLDIDGPWGVFINAQYLADFVSAAPAELVRPDRDRIGTLSLRKSFVYDTITLEARWYRSFTDEDNLAWLSFEYAINDRTSLELAAHSFSGAEDGLFGQFAERDRITLNLSHVF